MLFTEWTHVAAWLFIQAAAAQGEEGERTWFVLFFSASVVWPYRQREMVGSNVDQLLYTVKIITNKTNNTVITLGSWIVGSKKMLEK